MRRSRLRSRPKKSEHDPALAGKWIRAVLPRKARCVVCGTKDGLQGHHVIPQTVLKAWCAHYGFVEQPTQRILWDVRNGIALCERDHSRHTDAYRRVPRYLLPADVWLFAAELDALTPTDELRVRIEQMYPEL